MKKVLFIVVALIVAQTFTSCRKKKETIANIYVLDEFSNPVKDATVVLFGTSTGDPFGSNDGMPGLNTVQDTVLTNCSGLAVFNLSKLYQAGQAGVAILDIKAFKLSKYGDGLIKIEPETTSEETVIIQP
jgi:hypothetical protein